MPATPAADTSPQPPAGVPAGVPADVPAQTPAGAARARAEDPALATRSVSAHLEVNVVSRSSMVMAVAVATGPELVEELLTVTVDGAPVEVEEVATLAGGRLHLLDVERGTVVVDYSAVVGPLAAAPPLAPATREELAVALRPSRYVDSDRLRPLAVAEFGDVLAERGPSVALGDAVTAWVRQRLIYVPGSSRGTDGATDTLLAGAGVCRDYSHLVAGLLRSMDVPTRVVGVYAPGLDPMDFHAVTEAWVDGSWHLFDATGLAPRQHLVRIATGRDTADTAFLSTTGEVRMITQTITAVLDTTAATPFPADRGPVRLP